MRQKEKFLDIPQLMARHHLKSRQTSAKRMKEMRGRLDTRQMPVPLSAVEAWDRSRTVRPAEEIRREMMMNRLKRRGA